MAEAKAWDQAIHYLYWKAVQYLLDLQIKSGEEYLKRVWDASSIYADEQYAQVIFEDNIGIKVRAWGHPQFNTCVVRFWFNYESDKNLINSLLTDLIDSFGYPSSETIITNDHVFVWQLKPTWQTRVWVFLRDIFNYFKG